jgi:ferrous iron transport protein B
VKILLVGNPNVGKSSLFSRLTGVSVLCSNYPGTTVAYCSGRLIHEGVSAELVDVPGIYSLTAASPAEKVAADMVASGDVVVNVIDSTNLERNLYLTLQLLGTGRPIVVALNMADDARHMGIRIDLAALEERLGVPVVETVSVTGEGAKELVGRLGDARPGHVPEGVAGESAIAAIVAAVQVSERRGHRLTERLEDLTIRPLTGIPLAAAALYVTFTVIVTLGNWAISAVLDPFFAGYWVPSVTALVESAAPSGAFHDMLVGRAGTDIVEGLGVLTTGVYVPVAMVLPFVVLFYAALAVLEDSGYLPRLATLMDNMMHRLGLHGSAIVPSVLGLGCRVPGILATRMLETRKQRLISSILLAVCVPCLAQNAVIIGLVAKNGARYVLIVYGTLLAVYAALGLALNRLIPGDSPEMLMEIPPYRIPNPSAIAKKTWMRVRFFLSEAVPYIALGVVAVNILYSAGAMAWASSFFGPAMSRAFGIPEDAVVAMVVGFLRKDFAVGMLAPIPMTPMQLTVAATLLVVYAPCLATLTVLYHELGLRDFLFFLAVMLAVTAATGVGMNAVFL